jgi:hypothetical protein
MTIIGAESLWSGPENFQREADNEKANYCIRLAPGFSVPGIRHQWGNGQ